jgi:hypothetical protein
MKSLRSFAIRSQIFESPEQQMELLQVLQQRETPLKEFRWLGFNQSLPNVAFALTGLKTLDWAYFDQGQTLLCIASDLIEARLASDSALPSLLEASKMTLQHLTLPLTLDQDPSEPLWKLDIPNLHTLRLKSEHDPDFIWPGVVNKFFITHQATLQQLTLEIHNDEHGEQGSICHLAFYHLPIGPPLKLRKLDANIEIVETAMYQLHSNDLEDLTIHAAYDCDLIDPLMRLRHFTRRLTCEKPIASLDGLKSLRFELKFNKLETMEALVASFGYDIEDGAGSEADEDAGEKSFAEDREVFEFVELLKVFANLCGNTLEELFLHVSPKGTEPAPIAVKALASSLCLFPRLTALSLSRFAIGSPANGISGELVEREYIRSLVQACQCLRSVTMEHRYTVKNYFISRANGGAEALGPVAITIRVVEEYDPD